MASGRPRAPRARRVSLPGAAEPLGLERARLTRRARGITVDRGRIVRETLAVLPAGPDAAGDRSLVARRPGQGTLRD